MKSLHELLSARFCSHELFARPVRTNCSHELLDGIDRCPPRKSFWGIASRYSGPRPIATTSVYACEGRELSIGRDTKLHRQVYMDKLGAAQAGAIISDVVTPLQLFLFTLNPHMDLSR